MGYNAKCWKLRCVGLMIGVSLLSACAMGSSEPVTGVCPPVVAYSVGVQARAAKEVRALPEGAAVVEMLSDYAVMRLCGGRRGGVKARISELLCMSNLAHASPTKEHDDNDDFQ